MDKEKFKMDMAVFSFKQHQMVLTYLNTLERNGWTVEDAELWINEEVKSIEEGLEQSKERFI